MLSSYYLSPFFQNGEKYWTHLNKTHLEYYRSFGIGIIYQSIQEI